MEEPEKARFDVSPRHWQIGVGQSLGRMLQCIIFQYGMDPFYTVLSIPDQDPFLLKVLKGSLVGIEQIRIEIKYPNRMHVSVFENGTPVIRSVCGTECELRGEAKRVLEAILETRFEEFSSSEVEEIFCIR